MDGIPILARGDRHARDGEVFVEFVEGRGASAPTGADDARPDFHRLVETGTVEEAVERGDVQLDDTVTAYADCNADMVEGASNADIKVGETMTFEDFLYCAMISSAQTRRE